MLYVCVLCVSCGSSQCCVLHDLQFVNTGRGCKREESTHPSRTIKSIKFFIESSHSYVTTLTHHSSDPLTTGPDYDSLLLLLTLASDVYPNQGLSRYPCSVCFNNVTSQCTSYLSTRCSIGYIQDVLVFQTLRIIVELMAGSVPPV